MIDQIIITILFFTGFCFIIYAAEYLHKHYAIIPEYTRKMAHSLATLSSLIFLFTIKSHWYILILGLFFFLLLLVAKRKMLFNSIDAVNRKTGGSYLLPVSVYIVFYISNTSGNNLLFILPILLLGISDPLAGFVGTYFRNRIKKITLFNFQLDKTIIGSSAFFISALIISMITLYLFDYEFQQILILSILITGVTTITELLSPYGTDNLTVPLITVFLLSLYVG
jgi:phytol kinase